MTFNMFLYLLISYKFIVVLKAWSDSSSIFFGNNQYLIGGAIYFQSKGTKYLVASLFYYVSGVFGFNIFNILLLKNSIVLLKSQTKEYNDPPCIPSLSNLDYFESNPSHQIISSLSISVYV